MSDIGFEMLAWAYSGGERRITARQLREVKATLLRVKQESREPRGRSRSRLRGFGPSWARRT